MFLELSEKEQMQVIEAVIFAAEEPVNLNILIKSLVLNDKVISQNNSQQSISDEIAATNFDIQDYLKKMIDKINEELLLTDRPFTIINISGGYQYSVRQEFGELLLRVTKNKYKKRLSQATLEVLAIIAYKQPISKPEIEQIRGVNSNEIVNSLIEKNLIQISGKSEAIGKPFLYSTTQEFLKTFGLNSLEELPKLKDFEDLSLGDDSNMEDMEVFTEILITDENQKETAFKMIKVLS